MKLHLSISLSIVLISLASFSTVELHGQAKIVTAAGSGLVFQGAGGPATAATLFQPNGIVVGKSGNVYVADTSLNQVFKIAPSGIITVFAGNGDVGPPYTGDGGPATQAVVMLPVALAVDSSEDVFIADNQSIREVTPNGIITTIAGGVTQCCPGPGDGGPPLSAYFSPFGLALDGSGNLYISDAHFSLVRKLTPGGTISTVAGSYQLGPGYSGDGGQALNAQFSGPQGLAMDSNGNLYIADIGNSRVRKVDTNGVITTVAGNGVNGSDSSAGDGGPATSTGVSLPSGVAVDSSGNLYIYTVDQHVRIVTPAGLIYTFAGSWSLPSGFSGDGGPATAAQLQLNQGNVGLALDSAGNLYLSCGVRVREVNISGIINTIAGNGQTNFFGDGGPATAAGLDSPRGLAMDKTRNLYVADQLNNRIRKLNTSGVITTFAGNGPAGFSGDGGPAVNAGLNGPSGLAFDTAGNLYIADSGNNRIRKINKSGVITTIAGTDSQNPGGDGGPAIQAQLSNPEGVVVSSSGVVYIADTYNNAVRSITTDGIIHAVAGSTDASAGFSGDGGPATSALLQGPAGLELDNKGNLYIADTGNWCVRKVSPDGTINTFAGVPLGQGSGGGASPTALTINIESPRSIVEDRAGNFYITADAQVIRVSPNGSTNTWAGQYGAAPESGFGDNGPAVLAVLGSGGVFGLALDQSGNLFIADGINNRVREVIGATASPQLAVSPMKLSFVSDGTSNPPAQMITVNNPGAGSISWYDTASSAGWLSIPAGGANAPGPSTLSINTSAVGLAPGTYNGSFIISDISTLSSVKPQVVKVQLLIGTVALSPKTLNLGSVAVGDTSAVKTVTLNSHEYVPLNFSNIQTSAGFSAASNTCGTSIGPGVTCTVGVTFSPTTNGVSTGTLTFTDNATNSPQSINLTGTGTTPVTLSPATLNLGSVAVGSTSAAKTVTLTNHENVSLNFSNIQTSAGFSAASNTCGTSIAAGVTCTIGVTFSPTATGGAVGALTFTDDAANSSQTVNLTGTGIK